MQSQGAKTHPWESWLDPAGPHQGGPQTRTRAQHAFEQVGRRCLSADTAATLRLGGRRDTAARCLPVTRLGRQAALGPPEVGFPSPGWSWRGDNCLDGRSWVLVPPPTFIPSACLPFIRDFRPWGGGGGARVTFLSLTPWSQLGVLSWGPVAPGLDCLENLAKT